MTIKVKPVHDENELLKARGEAVLISLDYTRQVPGIFHVEGEKVRFVFWHPKDKQKVVSASSRARDLSYLGGGLGGVVLHKNYVMVNEYDEKETAGNFSRFAELLQSKNITLGTSLILESPKVIFSSNATNFAQPVKHNTFEGGRPSSLEELRGLPAGTKVKTVYRNHDNSEITLPCAYGGRVLDEICLEHHPKENFEVFLASGKNESLVLYLTASSLSLDFAEKGIIIPSQSSHGGRISSGQKLFEAVRQLLVSADLWPYKQGGII